MDNSFQRRFEDAVKAQFTGLGVAMFNSLDRDTKTLPCLVFDSGQMEDEKNIGCYTGRMSLMVRSSSDVGDAADTGSDNAEIRHGDLVDSVGEILFASGFLAAVQGTDATLLVYRVAPSGASFKADEQHFETDHLLDFAFTPI